MNEKKISDLSKEELLKYHHSPETELSVLVVECAKKKEYGLLKDYLQFLTEEDKGKIDTRDSAGMTALHCAVGCSSLPAVILLLKYGADVNAKDMLGFTPLFLATGRYPNTDIALRLIKEGNASVETETETGATALHGAALQGNTECVKLLLENGADPRTEDKDGTTPFDLAKGTHIKEILHDAIINWDSKKDTNGATCSNCKKIPKDSVLKRCSQCHITLYCSKECQVQHWKQGGHRSNCSGFVIAKPMVMSDGTSPFHVSLYHVMGSQKKNVKMYERKPDDAPKRMEFLRHKKFVVKVQLPLDTQESKMMVYNADRTCEGFVHPEEKAILKKKKLQTTLDAFLEGIEWIKTAGYKQLATKIRKEGFLGIKAFFWAELMEGEEGKFKVFHGKTAPFQKW